MALPQLNIKYDNVIINKCYTMRPIPTEKSGSLQLSPFSGLSF